VESMPSDIRADDLSRNVRCVTSAERNKQRGPACTRAVLQDVIEGSAIPDDAHIVVIEWFPGDGADWYTSVATLMADKLSGASDGMKQKLLGMVFAEDDDHKLCIRHRFEHKFYNLWYNDRIALPDVGRVGPKELDDNGDNVAMPALKVGAVSADGHGRDVLYFPASVVRRFDTNMDLVGRWRAFVKAHEEKFGVPQRGAIIEIDVDSPAPHAEGVNVTYKPPPPMDETNLAIDACTVKTAAELEHLRVVSAAMPLGCGKNISVWITHVPESGRYLTWLDGTQLEADVELPALTTQVFGFGLGSWTTKATDIQFTLDDDMSYLTMLSDDKSKQTSRLCFAISGFTRMGKETAVCYHTLKPLVRADTNKAVSHRWTVSTNRIVSFAPAEVDIQKRVAEGKPLQWPELGAVYKGFSATALPLT